MVSRWPVVVLLPVTARDCDDDGRLTDAAVEHLFAVARTEYFVRCTTVAGAELERIASTVQRGDAAAGDAVTVSVNVVEVFPDRFTMTARFRPADTDGIVATAWCTLTPGREVPTAMRDEFIALAQSATHFH